MKIVFSDLDGTLLDHHTYSFKESQQGMEILKLHNAPLVLVSSKTYAEMKELHEELSLEGPFVFENGGGYAVKNNESYTIELTGLSADKLKEMVSLVEELLQCGVRLLPDMDVREVVELTGLPEQRALLARQRQASLPFILLKEKDIGIKEINNYNAALQHQNVRITKGGRFFHFSSIDANKGNAVKKIVAFYKNKNGIEHIETVGIGDSENDIPLLMAVDVPFLVKKINGRHIQTGIPGINKTQAVGPQGFTEAMIKLFDN